MKGKEDQVWAHRASEILSAHGEKKLFLERRVCFSQESFYQVIEFDEYPGNQLHLVLFFNQAAGRKLQKYSLVKQSTSNLLMSPFLLP